MEVLLPLLFIGPQAFIVVVGMLVWLLVRVLQGNTKVGTALRWAAVIVGSIVFLHSSPVQAVFGEQRAKRLAARGILIVELMPPEVRQLPEDERPDYESFIAVLKEMGIKAVPRSCFVVSIAHEAAYRRTMAEEIERRKGPNAILAAAQKAKAMGKGKLPAPRQTLIRQALPGGYAGYTEGTHLNRHGVLMNSMLMVNRPGEPERRFRATYPFIEAWEVDGETVMISSRGAHGPAVYERFNLQTGKILETLYEGAEASPPPWVTTLQRRAATGE